MCGLGLIFLLEADVDVHCSRFCHNRNIHSSAFYRKECIYSSRFCQIIDKILCFLIKKLYFCTRKRKKDISEQNNEQ